MMFSYTCLLVISSLQVLKATMLDLLYIIIIIKSYLGCWMRASVHSNREETFRSNHHVPPDQNQGVGFCPPGKRPDNSPPRGEKEDGHDNSPAVA